MQLWRNLLAWTLVFQLSFSSVLPAFGSPPGSGSDERRAPQASQAPAVDPASAGADANAVIEPSDDASNLRVAVHTLASEPDFATNPQFRDLSSLSRHQADFIQSFQESVNRLDGLLSGAQTGSHPLDIFQTLRQTVVAAPGIDTRPLRLDQLSINTSADHFNLVYRDHAVLNRFDIPVRSATRFGNYIVFIEDGSFDRERGIQVLSFIDLEYFRPALIQDGTDGYGQRTDLPVYRIPVQATEAVSSLTIRQDGDLAVGNTPVSPDALGFFATIWRQYFQFSVAAVDPDSYERVKPILDDFMEFSERALEIQTADARRQVESITGGRDPFSRFAAMLQEQLEHRGRVGSTVAAPNASRMQGISETIDRLNSVHQQEFVPFLETFAQEAAVQDSIRAMGQQLQVSRRLMTRLSMLWHGFSAVPQPLGAPRLKQALAFIAQGYAAAGSQGGRQQIREGVLQLVNHRYARAGAAAVAGAVYAAFHPEQTIHFVQSVLQVNAMAGEIMFAKVRDLLYFGGHVAVRVGHGYNPVNLAHAYFRLDRLPREVLSLSCLAGNILAIVSAPHILMNMFALVRDMSRTGTATYREAGMGRFEALLQAFIDRQDRQQRDFIQLQADAEAELMGQLRGRQYTEEETAAARAKIAEIKARRGYFGRMVATVRNSRAFAIFSRQEGSDGVAGIRSFWGALRNFILSANSLHTSGYAYAGIWNVFFGLRSFALTPSLWPVFLMYPGYLGRVIGSRDPARGSFPTELNGGRRGWMEVMRRLGRLVTDGEGLAQVRAWEDRIVPIEEAIQKAVLERAFPALVSYSRTDADLARVTRAGNVESLTSPLLQELSFRQRTFFRVFYERASQAAMTGFLREVVMGAVRAAQTVPAIPADPAAIPNITLGESAEGSATSSREPSIVVAPGVETSAVDVSRLSLDELKRAVIEDALAMAITPDQAARLVDQAIADGAPRAAARVADRAYTSLESGSVNFAHYGMAMAPQNNRQVNRIVKTLRQMADPRAMARAVRAMVASHAVDRPIEIAVLLMTYAAINDGPLAPFQPEWSGPNAVYGLSRQIFFAGLTADIVVSSFADLWSKLQQDYRLQAEFGNVPTGEDMNRSFSSWYRKAFFNPENSLMKNWAEYNSLIWANMRAALLLMGITQAMTLRRFDLGFYIAGYILAYGLPTSALQMKVEQAFEIAAGGYDAREFPAALRAHPEVVQFLSQVKMRRRLVFNMMNRFAFDFIGGYISVFAKWGDPAIGRTRTFLRILTGGTTPGYTVDELAVMAIRWGGERGGHFPLVGSAVRTCARALELAITNNNTDLYRLSPPGLGSQGGHGPSGPTH